MGARRCSGPWLVTLLALATMSCGDRSDDAEIGSAPADAARPPRPAGSASAVDPGIPEYQPAGGASGNLTSVGSDSLNNLMTLWAEEFRRRHPNVRIQIEGKGSSTAPPALIEGTAQVGPMSRPMKPSETDAFEKRFGYRPTEVRVALDALALYVHRDNPLERLTFPQVDAIFSTTRACGGSHELARWGDLQVAGPLAHRQISLYGRNSASGTYGYFKEHALCGGDFKDTVKEQPGSASVVSSISEDPAGIGYSGIGYRTSGVKAVALAETEDGPFHPTTSEAVLAGRYPLARHLFLYVNRPPERPLDPLVLEFLRFVLSRSGQQVVLKDGYLPLPAGDVAAERTELE